MSIEIRNLDHLVLTVKSIAATTEFYEKVLGMEAVLFGGGRVAIKFGESKVLEGLSNVHHCTTYVQRL